MDSSSNPRASTSATTEMSAVLPPQPPMSATTPNVLTSADSPPSPPQSAAARSESGSPPPPPLDPRIQIELENLNTATDNINRLEIELEEANATFRLLLNESTRRLKLLSKKLGSCIDKSRPYHEAADRARLAQIDCQAAAVQFQRAHEHYAAAKETVALAEQRFMSGSHEWQFDNAWQEMLNHATLKVSAAEQQKRECRAEHERKAAVFRTAELRSAQLEDSLRRNIQRSRPYFEEKQICQDQLQTQKERIQELQQAVALAKRQYAQALKALESISEEIHRSRAAENPKVNGKPTDSAPQKSAATANVDDDDDEDDEQMPRGPREPGVGAEKGADEQPPIERPHHQHHQDLQGACGGGQISLPLIEADAAASVADDELQLPSLNYARELDRCEVASTGTAGDGLAVDEDDEDNEAASEANLVDSAASSSDDAALEALRQHVKLLAVRPVDGGGDGQQTQDVWETELNATVDRLDRLLMQRENASGSGRLAATLAPATVAVSMPGSPMHTVKVVKVAEAAEAGVASPARDQSSPVRQLLPRAEPLPKAVVSMRELPMLARLSTELTAVGNRQSAAAAAVTTAAAGQQHKRRKSLE